MNLLQLRDLTIKGRDNLVSDAQQGFGCGFHSGTKSDYFGLMSGGWAWE